MVLRTGGTKIGGITCEQKIPIAQKAHESPLRLTSVMAWGGVFVSRCVGDLDLSLTQGQAREERFIRH